MQWLLQGVSWSVGYALLHLWEHSRYVVCPCICYVHVSIFSSCRQYHRLYHIIIVIWKRSAIGCVCRESCTHCTTVDMSIR